MPGIRIINHPIAGRVRWRPTSDQAGSPIELLDGWAADNIITVDVPQFRGIPTYGNRTFDGRVAFYKAAASQLKAAWAEVEQRGLMAKVIFWSGSFVPRLIRGSTRTPSNHAFGTAFDINHQQNGLGVIPPPVGAKGSVRELVPFFEKHGFFWGGNYKNRPDGMHFEIAALQPEGPPQEVDTPDSVEVFINGAQMVIPALLLENRTWVGARAFVRHLGGRLVKAGGDPFTITVEANNTTIQLLAKNIDGIGYVAFRDINSLYNLSFNYNSQEMRLDITK